MASRQFLLVVASTMVLSFGAVPSSSSLRASHNLLQVESALADPGAAHPWVDKTLEFAHRLPLPLDVQWLKSFAEGEVQVVRGQPPVVAMAAEQQSPWVLMVFLFGFWWFIFSVLVWIVLVAVIAHFYLQSRKYPELDASLANSESQGDLRNWTSGFCSCYEDCLTCWCGLCCPAIRWAETLSLVDGLLVFWVGFVVYLSLSFMNILTSVTLLWLALVIICTAYRQELRSKFDFERQGGCSVLTDCLLYTCCTCCAIIQEARHVEAAMKYGHPCLKTQSKEPTKE